MTDTTPPYYQDEQVTLLLGDALEQLRTLPDGAVDCIVTSPPYYGLRDYGTPGQYGLEATPAEYVETMRALFGEASRVLADDGTLWLNLGDSYAAAGGHTDPGRTSALQGRRVQLMQNMPSKPTDRPRKNLLGIPWRTAFALQDDGWILRNEIIWHKTNAMPESIKDRLSTRHEHLFLFAKQQRYWYDLDSIREPHTMRPQRRPRGHKERQRLGVLPAQTYSTSQRDEPGVDGHSLGRNPGDVWSIPTRPYPGAHFAVFPIDLPLRCIKAGCRRGGTVLDPFSGSGTTGAAARQLGRQYVGIDLNPAYHDLARERFAQGVLDLDLPA
ncbi:site-specific DNA-methyltransferase [Streptomyces sp. KC 17012]|jgi:site-specific DNA-methyltransferase (cytosine-N4-specific)|uniref:DNA-methyltransferase n=1 Tax=Streptomyces plumbidurans TaxID=2814589 RepID=UPI001C9D8A60|nr:site-specific DNA-methyltransferase [Streptomyces plumbidurans]MBY8341851.1 site-specific DNA-methyltransferase [Streptomyces plumbidurans]